MTLSSCNSGPARVNQPDIDASAAGQAAMDEYDTNGDGVVAGDELDKAPGLKALLATADTNKDGGISSKEVTERINKWKEQKTGVTMFSFVVTLDGRPLNGALLTFEPESFLGDDIQAAVGETGFGGSGGASIPKDQRPSPKSPPGVQLGLYRVKISKKVNGKEIVPPKYNEQSILAQEIAGDVPGITGGGADLRALDDVARAPLGSNSPRDDRRGPLLDQHTADRQRIQVEPPAYR